MRKFFVAASMLIALTCGTAPAFAKHSSHQATQMSSTKKVSSKHKKSGSHKHQKHAKKSRGSSKK